MGVRTHVQRHHRPHPDFFEKIWYLSLEPASHPMQATCLPAFLPERSIRFSPTGSALTISPDRRGIFLPARCVGLAFEQDTGAESSLEYCDQPIPRRAFAPVFKLLISRIQIFLKKSGTCRPVRRHTLCKQRACPLFSLSGNGSVSPKPDNELRRRSPRRRSFFWSFRPVP